jgi:hypothetical protein
MTLAISEWRIESRLKKGVERLGGRCIKFVSPGRRNVVDRLVLMAEGRIYFVELKAEGEVPNDGQLREHYRLRKMGFKVYVLDSFELVDQFLRMIQWPAKP